MVDFEIKPDIFHFYQSPIFGDNFIFCVGGLPGQSPNPKNEMHAPPKKIFDLGGLFVLRLRSRRVIVGCARWTMRVKSGR